MLEKHKQRSLCKLKFGPKDTAVAKSWSLVVAGGPMARVPISGDIIVRLDLIVLNGPDMLPSIGGTGVVGLPMKVCEFTPDLQNETTHTSG